LLLCQRGIGESLLQLAHFVLLLGYHAVCPNSRGHLDISILRIQFFQVRIDLLNSNVVVAELGNEILVVLANVGHHVAKLTSVSGASRVLTLFESCSRGTLGMASSNQSPVAPVVAAHRLPLALSFQLLLEEVSKISYQVDRLTASLRRQLLV
jgi:hypothetical protein